MSDAQVNWDRGLAPPEFPANFDPDYAMECAEEEIYDALYDIYKKLAEAQEEFMEDLRRKYERLGLTVDDSDIECTRIDSAMRSLDNLGDFEKRLKRIDR